MVPDKATLDNLRIDRSAEKIRGIPRAQIAAALILIAAVVFAIWWLSQPAPVEVTTATVQSLGSRTELTLLNATGYVVARREATVSSKVTGRIATVLMEEGMHVDDNQILATIDSSNVDVNLELANAQFESAKKALAETRTNLEQAERELTYFRVMVENDVLSRIQFERAETTTNSLRARLEWQAADAAVAERQVALWQQQLDDTVIRAPFAGIVTTKNAQPGEMISPMSAGGSFTRSGICTIVDMSSLEIEVDVSESYINRVEAEQPVLATLDAYPDWKIPAKVIAIIPTADRQKATVKVRIAFIELDPRILPEMSVKAAFQSAGESENVRILTIPAAAIRERDGREIVFVVADGIAERRAVSVASRTKEIAEIAAGVSAGETIVVEGPLELADGDRVTEKEK
ncbi:MAG: efflux RND transporter periplasmic adaptor subunit [Planctomycetes bacterium]|nr:efflux RND transporter periplasmic adaptor subunit [Planctomycetota bacterium]